MRWIYFFVLLGISTVSLGELVWEQANQSRRVDVREGETVFYFRFHNAGKELVNIRELKSSCGCLTSKLVQRDYKPGEGGVIKIVADLNGREGHVGKSLQVITSNQPTKPYKLSVNIDIPKGYSFSSRRLMWTLGESDSQTCVLKNPMKVPVKLVSVACQPEFFDVHLEMVRDGFEYKLHIKPHDSGRSVRSVIQISTEPSGDSPSRTYKVYAMLR